MSETSDNNMSETLAERRARIRRQKIMSESDSRLKKILSVNEKTTSPPDVMTDVMSATTDGHKLAANDSLFGEFASIGGQLANHLLNDNSMTELRHRLNGNGIDWQTIGRSVPEFEANDSQSIDSIDRTFPRKVSLISTPIDYKTLQQSHQNNTTSGLTSHLVWMLGQNLTKLSVVCVLLAVAVVASLLRLNFVFPFFVTQLLRLAIVTRSQRNNGSHKRVANIWIVASVCQHLVIFVFTYITVHIFL